MRTTRQPGEERCSRAAQPTCFLIADISGYTGYLADVELDHAQDILADLIGAVVTALRPNFRLAKLEGDAAFTFAIGRDDRRVDAPRHHRALLLRVPPAPPRRPPGDVVRVQRLRPDPGPRPQVRRPPRRGHPPEGRRPAGAPRVGRDRRPPAAQERGRRAARHRRLRPDQPGRASTPPTSTRPRSACARTPRPTTGSATCRPGSTTSSAAGRRRRLAGASSSTPGGVDPHRVGADERAAAGGLGVPDQARAADVVAAVGDRGRRSRAPPAAGAGSARPTTACTARTRSSRRSSTGARTTTSPTGRSSTRRADR